MKTFNLTIKSKNRTSIKKFIRFFKKTSYTNFKTIQKFFPKKEKRIFISILKSPHVNKSAQEQFEIINNSAQITVQTTQPFKFLIFLKKIRINLFPDINIKLKLIFNKKIKNSIRQKFFNIDNYTIQNSSLIINEKFRVKNIEFPNSKTILSLFDIYGV